MLQFLLQAPAAPAAPGSGGGIGGLLLPLLLMGVVVYFFMILPNKKRQKEAANFQENLAKGSKVVTIGGIVGKLLETRSKTYVIEVEGGNKLQILKTAVSAENTKAFNSDATDDKSKEKEKTKEPEKIEAA
jgi:preprotein translocase subunit YajC